MSTQGWHCRWIPPVPLSGFTGEERVKAILDSGITCGMPSVRDAGEEAVTFLGGATGLYCGYLDFIAWDLPAVLTAAQAFFEGSRPALCLTSYGDFGGMWAVSPLLERRKNRSLIFMRKLAPCSRQRILKYWSPLTKELPLTLGKCSTGWRILSKAA